jgi:hypothetical protein
MDNLNEKLSNEAQSQPSCLGAVMCRFFKELYTETKEGIEEDEWVIACILVAAIPMIMIIFAVVLSS